MSVQVLNMLIVLMIARAPIIPDRQLCASYVAYIRHANMLGVASKAIGSCNDISLHNKHSSDISTLLTLNIAVDHRGLLSALHLQGRLCGGGAEQVGCLLARTCAMHVALRIGAMAWTWVICIRRYTVTHSMSHHDPFCNMCVMLCQAGGPTHIV